MSSTHDPLVLTHIQQNSVRSRRRWTAFDKVQQNKGLSQSLQVTIACILRRCSRKLEYEVCYTSIAGLAKASGHSERTTCRHLLVLQRLGAIERQVLTAAKFKSWMAFHYDCYTIKLLYPFSLGVIRIRWDHNLWSDKLSKRELELVKSMLAEGGKKEWNRDARTFF